MKRRVLVVEDEDKLRRILELQLLDSGFEVEKASKAEEALPLIDRADLILTDFKLPGMTGFEMLQIIRRMNSHVPVIVMTAFGTVENAVEAMKAGAADFLLKPFSLDQLIAVVSKALEIRNLREENRQLKEELGRKYRWDNIVGRSPGMQEIFATVMRVAPSRATVLLAGESGVGKDLIARAIHFHSPRKDRPFVKINCTALPENLMESELFGYEKGAFTGANISKPGKFEQADTGTVMLDEIGDVPANIQIKLLRVLQEREFERLGSNKTLHIDVRVIAATNRDLRVALEDGTFREDLYYRLNVVPIEIPPLRERKEDIPYLARHFVEKAGAGHGRPRPRHHRCRHRQADGLLLAGQRARTGERDRAQHRDGFGRETGCRRYPAGYESARAHRARRTGAAGRHEPRCLRAGTDQERAEAGGWKQEPGGAHSGIDPQRAAVPPDSDGY